MAVSILLSIKPRFALAILSGAKRFEFRRRGFAQTPDAVAIYATAPEGKIVGWFTVESVIEATPKDLWQQCGEEGAIEADDFFAYFEGCERGFALEVGEVVQLKDPIAPADLPKSVRPPQSFLHLDDESWSVISTSA